MRSGSLGARPPPSEIGCGSRRWLASADEPRRAGAQRASGARTPRASTCSTSTRSAPWGRDATREGFTIRVKRGLFAHRSTQKNELRAPHEASRVRSIVMSPGFRPLRLLLLVGFIGCEGHLDLGDDEPLNAGPPAPMSGECAAGECVGMPKGADGPYWVAYGPDGEVPDCPAESFGEAWRGHADLVQPECAPCSCGSSTGSCALPSIFTASTNACS